MSNVPNINKIQSIDKIPLIRQYPKPERKCGNKQILYRVHFVYKSRQTGEKYYNLVGGNFVFNSDNPSRSLRAGDLVKYKPRGEKAKEDPNYGQVARIIKITSPIKGDEALKKGLPINPDAKLTLVDIDFQNPKEVNNKVINSKEGVSMESLELLLKGNDIISYVCEESLIPKSHIREFELARDNYKSSKTDANKRRLSDAEDTLWNRYFEQDNNNQPMYPLLSEIHNPSIMKELNAAVGRMVKIGFTADHSDVKKKIVKKNGKKFARFPVPEGFQSGKKITVNIDGKDVVVKIPIQIDGRTPKVRQIIEVEILKQDNDAIFHKIGISKNKGGKFLEFIPTVILSDYSNYENGKMVLGKLVKPSSNQKFTIRSAEILKQGENNFDFKKLDKFDKDIEKLVLDLEVKVILELDVKDQLVEGEKGTSVGNLGRSIKSAILSGNALNCRENMRKLKEGTKEFIENVMPAGMKRDNERRRRNKKRDKESLDRVTREQKRILNNIQGRTRREGVRDSSNVHRRIAREAVKERVARRGRSSPAPSAPPLRSRSVGGRKTRKKKRKIRKKKTKRRRRGGIKKTKRRKRRERTKKRR